MKKTQHNREELSVHVKGKNITVTPALHDQVMHKMGKLDKYLDRLQGIEVELRTEQTRSAADHNCVDATTHVLGRTIRVSSVHEDMYAAIDDAVDKLYRQLNKQKERVKSHQSGRLASSLPEPNLGETGDAADSYDRDERVPQPVVRVERLEMKPQFEDEAIQEMEGAGHDFYVFLNARSEQVNVLYRHSDGGFRLIEPHVR